MKWKNSPKAAAFIGMLGALSTILMMVSIPLPFAPGFLRFDVAELPALFAGFFIGPLGGCAVIVVKILLKLVIQGTDTAFVGELMNIIGSCAYVLPASLIYTRYHTKKGAGVSLMLFSVFLSCSFCSIAYIFTSPSSVYRSIPTMPTRYCRQPIFSAETFC